MNFKKFISIFVKVTIALAAIAGIIYAVKKFLDKKSCEDLFDDFDDFDDDFETDDDLESKREYVSLNITPDAEKSEESTEAPEEKEETQ